ncbi:MAG: hypothetical protein ACLQMF_20110 [Rectinemataceae bacterium]
MEIKIDEAMVKEAMEAATTDAVRSAFGDWEIKHAVQEAVSRAVMKETLVGAITSAVDKIDLATLSEALAVEMARSTTKAVQHIIRESLVSVVLDMRGVPIYDDKKRAAARASIVAEIFGKHCVKAEPEPEAPF